MDGRCLFRSKCKNNNDDDAPRADEDEDNAADNQRSITNFAQKIICNIYKQS